MKMVLQKNASEQMRNEKNPGWLDYIGLGDYTTQLYRDYFINHYKDPY